MTLIYLFKINGYNVYRGLDCYWAMSDTITKMATNYDNLITSL